MYEAAFQICEEDSMRKAYVYCCKKFMSEDAYKKMLAGNEVYQVVDEELEMEIKEFQKHSKPVWNEDTLSEWKEQYRRLGTGEI